MKDGIPIYRYNITREFRKVNLIETFPYSAQLPDINPIEHVWYPIKVAINKCLVKPRNEEELKKALLKEWEKIDIKLINQLIDSMSNQV